MEVIALCYEAGKSPLLSGRHGVGKSEALEAAADELKIEFITCDLSVMEPPDLVGLPTLGDGVTHYCPPAFLPTRGRGLLVFEELNRCASFMRAPCLQLLTARRLHQYVLPPGWLPAAAINPAEEGYEAFELDAALLSRFVRIHVEPDPQEWLDWASRKGVHAAVLDYVRSDPEIFHHADSNPRAWAYVSDILHAEANVQASSESVRAAVVGLVGEARGAAFLAFRQGRVRPLTADQVLSAYADHRPQLQQWVKGGKLDLVRGTLLALQKALQSRRKYEELKINPAKRKHVAEFLEDLPGDLRVEMEDFFAERDYPLLSALGR
jgi:MoxR-like ATPase